MRIKDLKQAMANGTHVAVENYAPKKGTAPTNPRRCVVVSLGNPRRVSSSGGWSQHTVDDGVRIRSAGDNLYNLPGSRPATKWDWRGVAEDAEVTEDTIVGPRQVFATWSEVEEQMREVRRIKEGESAEQHRAERIAEEVNKVVGGSVARAHYRRMGGRSYEGRYEGVQISSDGAEALLKKLAAVKREAKGLRRR